MAGMHGFSWRVCVGRLVAKHRMKGGVVWEELRTIVHVFDIYECLLFSSWSGCYSLSPLWTRLKTLHQRVILNLSHWQKIHTSYSSLALQISSTFSYPPCIYLTWRSAPAGTSWGYDRCSLTLSISDHFITSVMLCRCLTKKSLFFGGLIILHHTYNICPAY